jgi:peptidoglycan hydrolase-like protein with peptidoglycan-binding domain
LKDKGHDPGAIDGVIGPKTRGALESFQKAEGIDPTGRPDAKTLAALGIKDSGADSGASASPKTSDAGKKKQE